MTSTYLHVTNNSPGLLVLRLWPRTDPVTVPPGRFCFSFTEEPHCPPKGDG